MKLVLISILAAITALTTATPVTEVEPLPFEEGPMQWTGEVIDGEGLITLEGSLPEIMDQIKTINPQYFDTDHSNEVVSDDGLTKRQVGGCEPRGIDVDIMCDVPYGTVHGKDLRAGLSYLGPMSWRSGGCMTQRANRCGRISCSYNTAIFVCADGQDVQYTGALIASIGLDMFSDCADSQENADFTAQAFMRREGWNILFKRQLC